MSPFLKQVANYLYTRHRSDISEFCLVFPGRRAGIFFTAYLNELIESPIISPEILSIKELISSQCDLQETDAVSLVLKLQKVYSTETGHIEPLDEFFFWGEILLSDFDDVDKYMLDANDLFRNISDLKDIENQFEYLSAEQKKAIDEFWGNLDKVPHSFNKEKFIKIWIKLSSIYQHFKENLKKEKIAFSGMIFRDVAENINTLLPRFKAKKYVFIGFNALNECEKTIFRKLEKQNKALFFWDFGDFYLKDSENEAGRFLRTNLVQFPPPKDFILEDSEKCSSREISLISVPGNITQAQAINLPDVVDSFCITNRFDNTAFVLADENLLIPVISTIGNKQTDINITMGYPFVNTPAYGFIYQIINLQKNVRKSSDSTVFYHKPVISILNHQYLADNEIKQFVSEIHKKNKIYISSSEFETNALLSKIFRHPSTHFDILDYFLEILKELSIKLESRDNELAKLELEYLFQAYLSIQRLKNTLLELNVPEFPEKILYRLLDQCIRRISIPFEGEPLTGLQVMGLLETRSLDFDNLIIFSANEGFLPRMAAAQSFIPYHLRKGFGIPTYEDRDAMYAYYFYRLIHRSKKTVLVYNSVTEGTSSSEKSRFLYQLIYDSNFKVEESNVSFSFKSTSNKPISIESTAHHIQKLEETYSVRNLSPSAINTYLDCKLKFYFRYLAGIKEKDELKEEIDAALFGNLFHYAMEILYRPFLNKTIEAKQLVMLRGDTKLIKSVVIQAIGVIYYKLNPEKSFDIKLTGQSLLIASHIEEYIIQLLENDIKNAPFRLEGIEAKHSTWYSFQSQSKEFKIKIGGIVDRIDRTVNGLRIIDYKTGRQLKLDFKDWSQLVDRDYGERRKEIFQTLIYADIMSRTDLHTIIQPAIYKLDNLFDQDFSPYIVHNNSQLVYEDVKDAFNGILSATLSEIFSIGNIYDQVKDQNKCGYCPYNKICRR
jgi:CRISPR/Cas system-associated exonuclease Cas4 (RecB family)